MVDKMAATRGASRGNAYEGVSAKNFLYELRLEANSVK